MIAVLLMAFASFNVCIMTPFAKTKTVQFKKFSLGMF